MIRKILIASAAVTLLAAGACSQKDDATRGDAAPAAKEVSPDAEAAAQQAVADAAAAESATEAPAAGDMPAADPAPAAPGAAAPEKK